TRKRHHAASTQEPAQGAQFCARWSGLMEAIAGVEHEKVAVRSGDAKGGGKASHRTLKTHCRHGHPFSGDNLKITKAGLRICKVCAAAWQERDRIARKRAGLPA